MKKLLYLLKDYKKESVLAPFFKLLEALLELLVPLIMVILIDRGIETQNYGIVRQMCLLLVCLAAVGLAFSVTAQYFAAKAAMGFGAKLRQTLFSRLLSIGYTQIDQLGSSAMITHMTSDINQIQTGVNMVLRLFLRSPVIVFGAAIMAFTIDIKSAIIFVIVIPLMSAVVFLVLMKTIPMYRRVQKALEKVLNLTRENLTGIRVLRAFHKEKDEIASFAQANQTYFTQQVKAGQISVLLNPLTFLLINGALIVLIRTGAVQTNVGTITQGQLVALISYMSQILVELVKLANLVVTMTKALACAGRVSTAMEQESEPRQLEDIHPDRSKTHSPYLEFDHVSLTYEGAQEESLTDIHFSVNEGETIGILGGTGSGKTSLVNLIPRFYEATHGSIRLCGVDIRRLDSHDLRLKVGIVPQKVVLFKGSIETNLKMGKEDATEEEMKEALTIAQAMEFLGSEAEVLKQKVSAGGLNFSGGQRQRLTIARALVRKPEILILDDSSSALDYLTDVALRRALKGAKARATFLISQRHTAVRGADRILVLEDGKMVGFGTHEELLLGCSVYREIVGEVVR
ncbi:MAG: ABC transporter ATP-binding protein/permease [Lachnospiraceae bacterium]|jgi:ABC-type multidrug transport system fused ATPase/permease subunit|nr:ABC transporter ATP-binding protein/permease [Lachnospiraceae bacterium]